MENYLYPTVLHTKVNGRTICLMDSASIKCQMDLFMKVTSQMVSSSAKANTTLITVCMKEPLQMTCLKAKES